MDERRTHYQVSFTPRQGLALFVGVAGAIVLAYFLGLMTGLSGRDVKAAPTLEAAAPASAAAPEAGFPAPVLGVSTRAPAGLAAATPAPRPTEPPAAPATPALQLFDDRPSSQPTRAPASTPTSTSASRPAAARNAPTPAPASGFWVQADSLSSRDQAEARRRGLVSAGFKAAVVPGTGPKGPVYRVRVGPYPTREDADRAALEVARKAKVARPWVVPPGQ